MDQVVAKLGNWKERVVVVLQFDQTEFQNELAKLCTTKCEEMAVPYFYLNSKSNCEDIQVVLSRVLELRESRASMKQTKIAKRCCIQ